MTATANRGRALAGLAAVLLAGGMAAAQERDLQGEVEAFQQRYEEAVASGDTSAVAALYAEDAIYSPITGGIVEGRSGVQGVYDQMGFTSVDLQSDRAEAIGEDVVVDTGTFAATMAGEDGETQLEGEYVVVAERGEDGNYLIRTNSIFPTRQAPGAAGE